MISPSLIKAEDSQLKLFSSDQMDPALFSAEESSDNPEFTGARLFAQKPDIYKAIVALSAEGLGVIRIGKILHVSPNTVLAVRAREPESVDIEKKRLAGLSREVARMCVEGIKEMLCDPVQVKKIGLKEFGIVYGILTEKSELLSGSPTARLHTIITNEDNGYEQYLCILEAEHKRRMGLQAGKEEQIAAPATIMDVPAPAARAPIALLEAPKGPQATSPIATPGANEAVGQTPHRVDDMPVNIDRNEVVKSGSNITSPNNFDESNSSK